MALNVAVPLSVAVSLNVEVSLNVAEFVEDEAVDH
jgi:hypothetical protein